MEKFSDLEQIEAEFNRNELVEGRARFNKILRDASTVQELISEGGGARIGLDILQEEYGIKSPDDARHVRVTGRMKIYEVNSNHTYDLATGLRKIEGEYLETYDEDVDLYWYGFVSEHEEYDDDDRNVKIKALFAKRNEEGDKPISWVSAELDSEISDPNESGEERLGALLSQYAQKTVEAFDELIFNVDNQGDVAQECLMKLKDFDYSEILEVDEDKRDILSYAFEVYAHNTIDIDVQMPYIIEISGYCGRKDCEEGWSKLDTVSPLLFQLSEIVMVQGEGKPTGLAVVGELMLPEFERKFTGAEYIIMIDSIKSIVSSRDTLYYWINDLTQKAIEDRQANY